MNDDNHTATPIRVAAIDIGSNSIRLTVAESDAPGRYRVLTDEKVTARLASTDHLGNLDIQRAVDAARAIADMAQTARGHNAARIRAVATAAVRDAPNKQDFINLVKDHADLTPDILRGDDEARLAHESVAHAFDLTNVRAAVIDIGGGSTDIAISTSGLIERLFTIPLGAVRLADKHGDTDHSNNAAHAAMRRDIEHKLDLHLPKTDAKPTLAFGTGGTFTALAAIRTTNNNTTNPDAPPRPSSVRGHEVRLADVAHTLYDLRRLDHDQRERTPGLSPQRAALIIPGLSIVDATMRRMGINTLRVHDRGVRDGIILSLLREHFQSPHTPAHTRTSHLDNAVAFGARCGFDEHQSRHVADIAISIFDQLATLLPTPKNHRAHWATDDNRRILETAALLRDVGYFINYKGHHKHSYHLIAHADLAPFTPHQTELVALTARYHRKAPPKKKHHAFNALDKPDQHTVRTLAAILRVADGLDRTHARAIDTVTLRLHAGTLHFDLHATHNPATDIAGAKHKADLLHARFKLHTRFEWQEPNQNPNGSAKHPAHA